MINKEKWDVELVKKYYKWRSDMFEFDGEYPTTGECSDWWINEVRILLENKEKDVIEKAVKIVNEKVKWAKGADTDEVYDLIRKIK